MDPEWSWKSVVHVWESGGWVMLPLFVLAALLYAQAIELLVYIRRVSLDDGTQADWFRWVRTPGDARGRVRDVVAYTQSDVSCSANIRNRFREIRGPIVDLVGRRSRFVGMLVAAAPLLGLLGTVLGMLQTFFGLATGSGNDSAGTIAAGISEALITTQTGLIIAIPGLFLLMLIRDRQRRLLASLARLECLTLSQHNFDSTSIESRAAKRYQMEPAEDPSIDLSSMIDCIFILLIFFIVTTVFVEERGLTVSKPDAAAVASLEDAESLTFEINADNQVFFEAAKIDFLEITTRVKAGLAKSDIPVVIRAHEKSDHGTFVSVWNAARLGGADILSFSTIN